MPFSKIFWMLFMITLVMFLGVLTGYATIEMIITLLIMDIAVLEINRIVKHNQMKFVLKNDVVNRLDNIGRICTGLVYNVSTPFDMKHAETKIHSVKEEVKEDMDKMAKKVIEIENDFFRFKRMVTSILTSMDKKMRGMEEIEDL